MKRLLYTSATAIFVLAFALVIDAQTLRPGVPAKFKVDGKAAHEFSIDLKADDVCNISVDGSKELPYLMQISRPDGEALVKEAEPSQGYVFIAGMTGTYSVKLYVADEFSADEMARYNGIEVTVKYSNKFTMPAGAKTRSTRTVNGYQARISDDPGDDGHTYFLVQRAGVVKAVMRAEKAITGGYSFSDDPNGSDGANPGRSAALMRTTPDKTGDGTPDLAVEYYTGGAHCCYEITFFELGKRVRQLPTVGTGNDRMTAIAKRPTGGLRFEFAEQSFAYWNINFAQSPMPEVIYEFDKSDKLVPRFDLMKKPAPSLARLRRDAASMKAKINLNAYTSPEDNFNDWKEPFWSEMLDLIYTGHEDLAWQYFDLVWPAKKKGKQKFLADFKEQLALSTYGEWKKAAK
jgi:hypothetical protein